jgi:8-oxo-dGTP pyrophosphatase MutT (NUDIX family)
MAKKKRKRRMSVEAVIFDPAGRVLLVRQGRDRGDWELPGGKVKKRESLPEAIVREILEETGIKVEPLRVIGVFYIPAENYFDWVVECQLIQTDSEPKPCPPEIVDCRFFALDKPPKKIRGFTLDRIADAREGTTHPLPVELTRKQWLGGK